MNEIRVLIVEDEPLIAQDIASILEEYDYEISGKIRKTSENTSKPRKTIAGKPTI